MSPNTTLLQAFTSPQPNSTLTDIIVNIVFGIAGTAISASIIYHGHRMWRVNGNRVRDEEHQLGSLPTTNAGRHVNDVSPTRDRPQSSGPSAPTPNGVNMNHVELDGGGSTDHVEIDGGENEGAWP